MITNQTDKKKIIFVQPTIPKYRESFFKEIYKEIGEDLIVYASDMHIGAISQKNLGQVWLKNLGQHKKLFFGLYWQVGVTRIAIHKNDIIVVSGAPRDISNLFLLFKANIAGAKTIWWGHFWSATSSYWRIRLRLFFLRFTTAALFYTDDEIIEFRKDFSNFKHLPVFSLNNGLDKSEIDRFKEPYNAESRKHHILFIGRLTLKSNLILLMDALSNSYCKNIHLHVIGDGEYLEDFQLYSKQINIENRIHWHGGIVDESRIALIANQCRLFVYPGAVGLSLIHALNYALPAVVHNNRRTHMPEIAALKNGVNGQFFDENNKNSLSKVISELVNDEALLNYMSRNAIKTTNKTFNNYDMVNRFLNVVRNISNN